MILIGEARVEKLLNSPSETTYGSGHPYGEVSEWFKEHAWKACVLKGTGGSNPFLSA